MSKTAVQTAPGYAPNRVKNQAVFLSKALGCAASALATIKKKSLNTSY
jgi:hypothetical protein